MKAPRILAVLVAMSLLFAFELIAQEQMQDVVYLKNGSVIRGMIIEQVPNKSIKVQTKDGSVFVYTFEEIDRMTRETTGRIESSSGSPGLFGVRGSIGTDVEGGLGYGGGVTYTLPAYPAGGSEFGLDFFYSKTTENTSGNRSEVTTLTVFAARANWLFNYQPKQNGVYFVAGVGFVGASLEWKEISGPNGTGNVLDDADYGTAGNVVTLGIGYSTTFGLEPRLEAPLLFFYSAGNAAAFVPTFTFGLNYRF